MEIFYIRAKLNPISNSGYIYGIISIEFFFFCVWQECNCVKRNLSSSPTKTEIQPNFKSSLFIAQICTFLQMSWQNTVWSITGKELFLKKHIDGRKILGKSGLRLFQLMDYDLERKCVFFFSLPLNGKTMKPLILWMTVLFTNEQQKGNWTKTVPQSFSFLDFKTPYIEYKPLRQYPSNVLTFCLIVKQHLLNVFFFLLYSFNIYLYMYI